MGGRVITTGSSIYPGVGCVQGVNGGGSGFAFIVFIGLLA